MQARLATTAAVLASMRPATAFAPAAISRTNQRSTDIEIASQLQLQALHSTTRTITEDQYPSFLSSASACAHSESCSLESAESYLREIVRIESACVAGTMSGEACGSDVARVSETVAALKAKIGAGAERNIKTFWQQRQDEFESLVSSSVHPTDRTLLSSVASYTQAPVKPTYIAIAALYTVFVISLFTSNDVASLSSSTSIIDRVVPFTPQEWYWAIRDGYASDILSAYFKNGGLLISENNNNAFFTPREIWWSIKDGYGWTLFSDWFRNGGGGGVVGLLQMDDNLVLTPQEGWWSLRDGYLSNLL